MSQIREIILLKKIQDLTLINQIADQISVSHLEIIQEEQNQENSSINLNI
jgi:hypothetical protein